ncbi:MAG: hypothetical protein ACLFST_07855 [Spirochaetia bacterium]
MPDRERALPVLIIPRLEIGENAPIRARGGELLDELITRPIDAVRDKELLLKLSR